MIHRSLPIALICLSVLSCTAVAAKPGTYTTAEAGGQDYAVQGEYRGTAGDDKIGIQVIALGDGKFQAVLHLGGLPGDGWNGEEPQRLDSELKDGAVVFTNDGGTGTLKDGKITIRHSEGEVFAVAEKVERESPTLGAKPPKGATVLFDGSSADGWQNGRLSDDGLLMQGVTSKQKFGSHQLHIEFRLPYKPKARGQGRGNSGIYIQGRYECQMLDSFGLTGEQNECGGLYSVKKPDLNMCFPPLTWQTYDIDYTAGEYDDDGKVIKNPRVTIKHNGVVIHDDIELPGERNTTAAPMKAGSEPGPVFLQDHGNPVRFRNIWIRSIGDYDEGEG